MTGERFPLVRAVFEYENTNMPQNIYDNPEFFAGYDRLRETGSGMNEVLEQPAFRSLLPDVTGLRVLDMGCGAGEMCRLLADQGAATVTGMDVSENMLEKALEQHQDRVTYIHTSAEEAAFDVGSFDLVVSSLMLHYVEDISLLLKKIHTWLACGGKYIFSMEHPVATATQGLVETRWDRGENGEPIAWRLAHYSEEGERSTRWFIDGVVKYHRTVATVVNGLIGSGFRISQMLEPHAIEEAERERPELIDERMRPAFLFIAAEAVK